MQRNRNIFSSQYQLKMHALSEFEVVICGCQKGVIENFYGNTRAYVRSFSELSRPALIYV